MSTSLSRAALPRARRGFTLWELLLALSIAAVVLFALGFAIDLHLRVLQSGRGEVEQAQLARAVLRRLGDDLRGAVLHDATMTSNAGVAAAPGDAPEGDMLEALMPLSPLEPDNGEDAESDSEQEEEETSVTTLHLTPGLYGGPNDLQVDVSRLPRLDEYATLGEDFAGPVATDVKTVSWFVRSGPASAPGAFAELEGGAGLVRHELDRAASIFAAQYGDLLALDQGLDPIAPEVLAVEFSYFDGREWRTEWDSEELGGLPVAVRIGLAMFPPGADLDDSAGSIGPLSLTSANQDLRIYSLVVRLPAAQPIDDSQAADEASEEDQEEQESEQPQDDNQQGGTP